MLKPDEFRELATAELDAVHRMAMHLARDPETARDLVQETYLRALKAERSFELRERGIRPWLFKILHNVFYTRLGRQARQPTLSEDLSREADRRPEASEEPISSLAELDWEQIDERLKHAIDKLPDHYREVLLLWAVEGLKYREIAEVLGVALGTVMSRLYRAREQLTRQLGDYARDHGIEVA